MRGGALFGGIGGLELALSEVGVEAAWGCDSSPFARRVFEKRFGVPVLPDVREIDEGIERVEFLGGGFPCQDLSGAGRGAGLDGERSSLYFEMHRVIAMMRPQLVLMENVPRLLRLHFGRLLRSLRDIGYNAEWDVISAAAVGAPHLRERLWIVAYEDEREVFGHQVGMLPMAHVDGDDDRAWPRAGRMRGSDVWELEPLAPASAARRGVLLPTPRAQDGKHAMATQYELGRDRTKDLLHVRVARGERFPTPVARDWKGSGMEGQLGTVAARGLWPTPTASDGRGGPGRAAQSGVNLRTAVSGFWPTPLASMAAVGQGGGELHRRVNHEPAAAAPEGGPLNPPWVEWLMGFPLGWTDMGVANDELVMRWWDDEPLPRTLRDVPQRRERLTALGNAIVWPAALVAAERLLQAAVVGT